MTRKQGIVLLAGGVWLAAAVAAFGLGANFAPLTYNPAPGEAVTFEVCPTCLGGGSFRFQWDFDSDGTTDLETADLLVRHAFDQAGYVEVTLTAIDSSGRSSFRTKGILVGESPLVAVRDVFPEDRDAVLVVVTLDVREGFSGLALEEGIPRGWQAQEVDRGGATVVNATGQSFEVLWAEPIDGGERRVFSYRLYPSYGTGVPTLGGVASGYLSQVATGETGKRVKVPVCGDLSIPQ
jgi:PKD repeat protein